MSVAFSLVGAGGSGTSNITVFVGGQVYTTDDSHPNFDAIVEGARAGDESIVELFDIAKTAASKFERLSERVTVAGGHIFFDGEEVANALTEQVVRFIEEGEDFVPLVKFWEKLATNPNEHSREQLYSWLNAEKFTITEDGDIVGYKGVNNNLTSKSAGPGIVNGVPENGHLDNSVGNILEMARSTVNHNPQQGCSTGLHVGTWGYASGFGEVVLKVVVNPRDVVSVPTDCGAQKMRVCRYKVAEVVSGKVDRQVDPTPRQDTRENYKAQARDSRGRFLARV